MCQTVGRNINPFLGIHGRQIWTSWQSLVCLHTYLGMSFLNQGFNLKKLRELYSARVAQDFGVSILCPAGVGLPATVHS